MKVLWVSPKPSPYRVKLFNLLGQRLQLLVVYDGKDDPDRPKGWNSVKPEQYDTVYLKSHSVVSRIRSLIYLMKLLRGNNGKTVIGEYSSVVGMTSILYLKLARKPYIINADGGFIKKDGLVKGLIKRFFISGATEYLSPSGLTDRYLSYYGAKNARISRYIFSSVSNTELVNRLTPNDQKESIRSYLGLKKGPMILATGQFIRRKGFDILLESASSLDESNWQLVIVGGSPTDEYIEAAARSRIPVTFVKHVSFDKLKQFYQAADIFVLPTREDIWGLVINEAISHGLPVVSTNMCGSAHELILDGRNGFMIDSDDPKSLTRKLNILMNDNDLRLKFGTQSLVVARKHTLEKSAHTLYDILSNNQYS